MTVTKVEIVINISSKRAIREANRESSRKVTKCCGDENNLKHFFQIYPPRLHILHLLLTGSMKNNIDKEKIPSTVSK